MMTLMQQVREEEQATPPRPPNQSCSAEPTPKSISAHLLQVDLHQVAASAQEIREYTNKCILCAQQVKVAGHMKLHWQSTHPQAWTEVQQDAESAARSLRSLFQRPCQFCGSMAKQGNPDATHHATKCSAVFQVMAARKLHRDGHLQARMHTVRGPALKQREREPQYVTREKHNIMTMLKGQKAQPPEAEKQPVPKNSGRDTSVQAVHTEAHTNTEEAAIRVVTDAHLTIRLGQSSQLVLHEFECLGSAALHWRGGTT